MYISQSKDCWLKIRSFPHLLPARFARGEAVSAWCALTARWEWHYLRHLCFRLPSGCEKVGFESGARKNMKKLSDGLGETPWNPGHMGEFQERGNKSGEGKSRDADPTHRARFGAWVAGCAGLSGGLEGCLPTLIWTPPSEAVHCLLQRWYFSAPQGVMCRRWVDWHATRLATSAETVQHFLQCPSLQISIFFFFSIFRNFQLELRVFMILGYGCFKHFFWVCSAQAYVSFLTFSFSCLFRFVGKGKTGCDVSESG